LLVEDDWSFDQLMNISAKCLYIYTFFSVYVKVM